ncbi:MAG: gliding motility-associated C-terminal domain-containing protein [Bacteroidota bacterium]
MKFLPKSLQVLLLVAIIHQFGFSQTCPTSSISAGSNTTICSGQCASLAASITALRTTSTYSVAATAYTPFSYTGGATAIPNTDDVWSTAINIGFNFCYFGNTFNQVLVGSNGEVTFDITKANGSEDYRVNTVLPNLIEHEPNTICGGYRDIDPSVGIGSTVTYTTSGVAPCRRFIASWSTVPLYNCNGTTTTFQVVLYETSNMIDIYLQSSPGTCAWQGGRGLIGIQNGTGTTAVAPPGRNVLTAWTATNEAWRFTPTGAPTFTVSWAGPSGFIASGLTAAPCPTATSNYTATLNESKCDGSLASYTSVVQVSVTPTPTILAIATPTAICRGASSTLTASGATSYTWNPGALTGSSVVVTPTATIIYTVTGRNGSCTSTQTVNLRVNPNPNVTATRSPSVICGVGSSTLTAAGAATYSWNPVGVSGNPIVVTPTATTIYTVIGTSALGCTGTRTLNVIVSPTPTITASASAATICANSTVALTASGGTSYTWTPGSIIGATVVVTPTANTTYTVRGRNAAGCIATNTIFITVTPGITVTPVASPTVICSGSSSTLTASGAVTYTWNPGALTGATVIVTPTVNITYTVIGVGPTGCSNTKTISVAVRTPTITATKNPTIICVGNTATITASGASTYTWNPGASTGNTITVTPITTTIYTVTGTNTLGCVASNTVSMPVSPTPTILSSASSNTICSGSSTTLTASGASTYTWMPVALTGSTAVVSPTTNTSYTVTGRSAAGCTSTSTIDIAVNPLVTLTPAASPTIICRGNSSTLTVSGANTYTWMPGTLTGSNVVVSPTLTTTYSVTGTATTGCTRTATLTVNVSTISVNATSNPTILCSTSSATLTGTGALTYTWNPGPVTGNTIVVTPTATTIYTLTGTNAVGCTATRTLNLVVGVTPIVTASASPTILCSGATVTLSSTGATTYTWLPGSVAGATITRAPIVSTTYTVRGRNASGCIGTNTVFVQVNPNPTITAVSNPSIMCAGSSATLTANGASNYTWNPIGATTSSVSVSPTITTVYTVVATSSLGCVASSTLDLKVLPTPTVNASSSPTVICSGASATLTASGATTYTWNPGALIGATIAVTPSTTTIYTVTGGNAGCSRTNTISITVNSNPTITATSSPTAICPGGSATLTGSGGISYTWTPGGITGTTISVTPSVTTTYSVIGTNASGCSNTNTITLTVNPIPTITAVSNPTIICIGSTATLTSSGAFTYIWNPGALSGSTVTVTPVISTIYTVSATSTLGCSNTRTVSIAVSNPTVNAIANPTIICAGSTATLTGSGASTYTWNPGPLTGSAVTVTPISTTVYSVTGTTTLGCTSSGTLTLTVSPSPTITSSASPTAICAGNNSTLTASGASSYTWNPGGATGATISVTPTITTTYSVVGTNTLGCATTQTIAVSVNPSTTITASSNPTVICNGGNATLTANGGVTYTWNPGALTGNTVSVNPTITTTYTVIGINASGCSDTTLVTLTVGTNPTITATSSPTSICAGSNATLTGSGATSYTWNPGGLTGTTVVVTPTITVNYTVTGVNAAGCTSTNTLDVVVNPTPTVTAISTSTVICSGNSIVLSGSGAVTYTWNPGNLSGPIVIVSPSVTTTYTLNGNNGGACNGTTTIQISVNPTPTLVATSNPTILCSGGSATLTASGATNYIWNPGAVIGASVVVTPSITTTYTLTGVSGACSNSLTVNLVVGTNPTVTATASSNTICAGASATLTGNGAATYTWNPGSLTGATISVTPSVTTTYTLDGDNGTGCVVSKTVTINVNGIPSITVTATPTVICAGNSATLSASGATTYTWNPGTLTGASAIVTPSATTVYSVTGNNGTCSGTQTITLVVNSVPTLSISSSSSSICSGSSATLTASGASSYTWNPGTLAGAMIVVSPTTTTTYTVDGTNGSCTGTQTITLLVNPVPTITVTANSNTICAGVSATLTANGATTYTWNPGALTGATVAVSPTTTTTYTLNGDNGAGCVSSETITINVNSTPIIAIVATPTTLCAAGSVTLTGSGAVSYTWNPTSANTPSIVDTPTLTTTYTVTGADAIGCIATQTLAINVGAPIFTLTSSPATICIGGTATLSANGVTSYTWNPGGLTGTTAIVSPTATTTYTVDGNNGTCTGTQTITLMVSPNPTITATANSNTICTGTSATLTANGAATYTWNPGALTGATIAVSPTTTITYTVNGDNGSGCISSETITINVNSTPSLTIVATPTVLCAAGSVTLTASGATSYTWNPTSATTSTILDNPSVTTTYSVTGSDAIGCSATQTITINVGSPTITLVSSPTVICAGASSTLTASGAVSYTWNPGGLTGTTAIVSPTTTTTYTVDGNNGICTGTQTITLVVSPNPTITASASANTICAGTSATLTASGAVSYTWNPGVLTGTMVTVTPTIATTYTVNGDNGSGCMSTQTIAINVNPAPSLTIVATPTVLCAAGSVTLTASGASSYTWNPTSATTASIVDTPSLTTTYTVVGTDAIGCSATQTLTINVGPPTITLSSSSTGICIGGSATLTASGVTSYTWNPGALSGTTAIVSPTSTTTYTVDGDNGTCLGSQTITLVVSASPTVIASASSNTVCAGTSVTLTASGAATYTWNPGTLAGANVAVTPTTTSTYTVDGDNGLGCIVSETVIVNVNPAPSVSIAATPSVLCSAGSVTLTASGASSYTWNPTSATTNSVVDTPSLTTTYTVTATDAIGCTGTQTITISVGNPTITITSSSPSICAGSTATLTANGAATYTWNPLAVSGTTITDSPVTTTTYTVTGDNGFGCTSTNTFVLNVSSSPTITAVANPTSICAGSTTSLTASGATSYTWMPLTVSGATITDSPTTPTTYTVSADNGGCASSATVTVNVNPSPTNVTAITNGTLACATPSISLSGSSTTTGAIYMWTGPNSYTSAVQNPTNITSAGDYTLAVIDPISGCTATATTLVTGNTSIPNLTASSSGSLGCNASVTITASSTSTNTLNYVWSGPSSFIASVQSPTTGIAGDYTVSVTDVISGCSGTATLTVGTNTSVPSFTANILPATCSGTVANNDGSILVTGFAPSDGYDLVQAPTYTGSVTYPTATTIPGSGIITTTLNNPTIATLYTIRVFSANGCFADVTLTLTPTSCSSPSTVLGMTKAVGTPTFVNNNAYNVTYTIVATNASTINLTGFSIFDNLDNTFPLPTTYSVISTPSVTSLNSSLTVNPSYNGSSQTDMLVSASSTLAAGRKDTIVFTVQIDPNGFFGPFNNSAIGFGTDNNSIVVSDSSNTGFSWDPDNDGNPTNNDTATVVYLNPNTQIAVAKTGTVSGILADKTLDVTYTIQVKNLGNDTIKFVQVFDTLIIPSPATFTIKSGPSTSGILTANVNYNGNSDIGLLVPNSSPLAPGAFETITLVLNITPNGLTSITNVAIGAGSGADGGIARDTSNNGMDSDPNANGNGTEIGENVPTILELPDVNLFIPEVFTPDGDGKNDFFVIKGIEGRTVKLTVFNRWGNTVYNNDAYDNTWNGTPNVSGLIIGNNKLPQGTYYYIVEFEDEADKPVNGFVVLQY